MERMYDQLVNDLRYCGTCYEGLEACSEKCSRVDGEIDPTCACKLMLDAADAIEALVHRLMFEHVIPANLTVEEIKRYIEEDVCPPDYNPAFCEPMFEDNKTAKDCMKCWTRWMKENQE